MSFTNTVQSSQQPNQPREDFVYKNHLSGRQEMGIAQKSGLALYGLSSYAIGFSGLLAIIFSMAGFIPLGSMVVITDNAVLAIIINIALTLVFGLQHSIMARPKFKEFFKSVFGEASERSTFVWTSGVCAFIMVAFWQPLTGFAWQVESQTAQIVLWAGFAIGWTYLVAATFAINHWDLFGLRQVWFALQNKSYVNPEFKENWMYRFSRHPIMLGVLIGIWCVPVMTMTKLVLALCFTVYIFIGVGFEEKDLIREFGKTYIDYKKRVGMFFTVNKSTQ